MRDLSNDSDIDIYECYRFLPDNIRDLRFGNYIDIDNVYHYCYRGVGKDTFRKDRINWESYLCIQPWVIDEITNNLTKIRNRRLSSLHKQGGVIASDDYLTGLQISDMNARQTYNEIKTMAETIIITNHLEGNL